MNSIEQYDVVVAGGGSAGVGAAVGAARAGARTLLVETNPCLGGAATMKNVLTYCGLYTRTDPPKQVVWGVAQEVLGELCVLGGVVGPYRVPSGNVVALLDPEAAKLAYDRVCSAASVEVLLHTLIIGASRDGNRITSVTLQDHRGAREVSAKAFVDASGEADLAFFGGASTRYGSHGFAQTGSLGVRFGGIAPDADISAERWAEAVREAKAHGVTLLGKEKSLLVRLPISNDVISYIVDEDYDARNAMSIGAAEAAGREQARAYLTAIREIPGHERAYIVSTGPHFGTRESRHVNAIYQLTEDDVQKAARFDDSVALGAWPMEYHPRKGNKDIWRFIDDKGVYEIPLRTLRSRDTSNLFAAGRLADGERLAGGSLRVMGTAFATGQACGVASARHAHAGDADAAKIRKTLEGQGALIDADDLPDPVELEVAFPIQKVQRR